LIAYLKSQTAFEVHQLKTAQEMEDVTQHLANKNYAAVFACGGDGTLNIVSKTLVGTETAMGIVGLGSGNGFARHMRIPLQWQKSIATSKNPIVKLVDTAEINNIHFLNIAGIGFAAKISHAFKAETKRGLSGYARTVLKNIKMEPFNIKIKSELQEWEGEAWMVDICNGSQWGNNFRIEPNAIENDGILNTVIFKKMHALRIPALGMRFASNTVTKSPQVKTVLGNTFEIEFNGTLPLHVDGEAVGFIHNTANVKIIPNNLKVWVPQMH
jgi:YegS/Rv2252/BmrU family lipid kinase